MQPFTHEIFIEKRNLQSVIDKFRKVLFLLIIFLLPTQLGKHFWPDFSIVSGMRIDYLSPTVFVTDILIGMLALIVIVGSLSRLRERYQKSQKSQAGQLNSSAISLSSLHPPLSPLSLLAPLSLLIFGVFLSDRPILGLYGLVKIVEFSFFGYCVKIMLSNKAMYKKTVYVFAASMSLQSFIAVAQFINQGSLGGLFYYIGERLFSSQTPGIANTSINGALLLRPYGTLPHPNVLGAYLLIGIIFCSSLLGRVEKKIKIFLFTAIIVSCFGIIISLSRSVFFISASILGIVILYNLQSVLIRRKKKRNFLTRKGYFKMKYFGLAVILCVTAFFLYPLFPRYTQINMQEEAIIQREQLSSSAIEMFIQNPLSGVGIREFIPSLPRYQKLQYGKLLLQPVHNIYLLILAESGILGFLCMVAFILITSKEVTGKRFLGVEQLLFIVCVVLGLFDHYFLTLQQGNFLLAFVIGLIYRKQWRLSHANK